MKNPSQIKAFGLQLRKLREKYDMSQQDLANEAEISKLTIQRIENAKFGPTLDVLISIARAFKIPISQLLDFEMPE